MAELDKQIKTFIKDVEKFIAVALKAVQLSGDAKTQRASLLKSLDTIKKKYPSLQQNAAPQKGKDESDQAHLYTDGDAGDDDMYYEVPTDKDVKAAELKDVGKTGFLKKKDKKKFGSSSKKWCVIQQGVFYLFEKQSSKKQTAALSLNGFKAKDSTTAKKEFCFEMSGADKEVYTFSVSTEEERTSWVSAINKAAKKPVTVRPDIEEVTYSTAEELGDDDTEDASYENKAEEGGEIYDEAASLPVTGKATPEPRCVSEVIYDEAASHAVGEQEDETYEDTEVISQLQPDENSGTSKTSVRSSNSLDGYARAPVIPPKNFEELPYESMYYGMWDCQADTDTELSFKHGDVIQVLGREYESYNWLTCLLNGKIGLVPKDYLTPAYTRA